MASRLDTIQQKTWLIDMFPELDRSPIAVDSYISKNRFSNEIDQVFKHTWLCIGRIEELPVAGRFLSSRISLLTLSR